MIISSTTQPLSRCYRSEKRPENGRNHIATPVPQVSLSRRLSRVTRSVTQRMSRRYIGVTRARGTPPHPVQKVRTHTGSSSTSAGERKQAGVCWHDLWVERWPEGIPQIPHTKVVELERLEQQLGIAELTGRMTLYLEDPADWLIEHKHPIATFINRINSYEVPPPERPLGRIRNCPQCHADERGHDDTCQHCDWTREAWEAPDE